MTFIKILHAVTALVGAGHLCFAWALSNYFDYARPSRPEAFWGAVRPFGSDDDRVYITAHDETVF
jgi:hypothetical protein